MVVEEGGKRRPLLTNLLKRVRTDRSFMEILEDLDGSLVPIDGELRVTLRAKLGSGEVFNTDAEGLLSDVLAFKNFQIVHFLIVR